MASLLPILTMNPLPGGPSVKLKVESDSGIRSGLEQVLRLISEIKQGIVFMLDGFQQIGNYTEKYVEAILRSVIQTYPDIPLIFQGSSRHVLENMFLSQGKPFYHSSELMYLERIKEDDYRNFIRKKFSEVNRGISDPLINRILEWTRHHTWSVQYVCNHLYEKGLNINGEEQVDYVIHQIITDSEAQYINYRNLLPSHQYRKLKAVAVEDGVSLPISGNLIARYGLTSPGSV